MAQLYRDQFAHYFNVATKTGAQTTPTWELEGIGVDALSMSFNPQIDQYKTIIERVSNTSFKNYQIQSSVSGKRLYDDDAIYNYLNEARKTATAIETQLLEVDMADKITEGKYNAIKYNILIVINEFLGEDATISYDLYVKGNPVLGTAEIQGGKPVFTEEL